MSCDTRPEDPISLSILVFVHAATLVAYLLEMRRTYKTSDLQHPVFACVLQEVAVLSLCLLLHIVSLVLTAVLGDEYEMVHGMYIAALIWALQFHQLTWFAIACLR